MEAGCYLHVSHLNQAEQIYFQLICNEIIVQCICIAILCKFMKVISPKLKSLSY